MFPQGTSARLIEVAAAEVGTIEEKENLTKYGKFTKADGLPWCGSFVNWCANQAGVRIHSVVGTALGAHKFKEIQRWSNKPELGYIAFMDFPHDGIDRISHVGMVISNKGEAVKMIHASSSLGISIIEINQSTYWKQRFFAYGTFLNNR